MTGPLPPGQAARQLATSIGAVARNAVTRTAARITPAPTAPEPIYAAVSPAIRPGRSTSQEIPARPTALELIRIAETGKPGLIGYLLDVIAGMTARCPLTIEQRIGHDRWERVESPHPTAILARYQGVDGEDAAELERIRAWLWEISGEALVCPTDTPDGIAYRILGSHQILRKDARQLVATVDRVTGETVTVPAAAARRTYRPNPAYQHEPYSPFVRALPDIRTYAGLLETVDSAVEGRLLMNGIMWFDSSAAMGPLQMPGTIDGRGQRGPDVVEDFISYADRAFNNRRGPASRVPFPMTSATPPQWVQVGNVFDSAVLPYINQFLREIGRSVDFDASLAAEGFAAGNHWSSLTLRRDQVGVIEARKEQLCKSLTAAVLTPGLVALRAKGVDIDPYAWRVWFDSSPITEPADTTDQTLAELRSGLRTRVSAAQALGIPTDELPAPPGGLTEEQWVERLIGVGPKDGPVARSITDGQAVQAAVTLTDRSPVTAPRWTDTVTGPYPGEDWAADWVHA